MSSISQQHSHLSRARMLETSLCSKPVPDSPVRFNLVLWTDLKEVKRLLDPWVSIPFFLACHFIVSCNWWQHWFWTWHWYKNISLMHQVELMNQCWSDLLMTFQLAVLSASHWWSCCLSRKILCCSSTHQCAYSWGIWSISQLLKTMMFFWRSTPLQKQRI